MNKSFDGGVVQTPPKRPLTALSIPIPCDHKQSPQVTQNGNFCNHKRGVVL